MQYEWMHCLVQSCVCARACTHTSTTFDWISQRKTSTLSAPPTFPLTVLLIRNSSISSLHPHLFSAQFSGWQIWSLPLYLFFFFWTICTFPSLLTISRHPRTYQLSFSAIAGLLRFPSTLHFTVIPVISGSTLSIVRLLILHLCCQGFEIGIDRYQLHSKKTIFWQESQKWWRCCQL